MRNNLALAIVAAAVVSQSERLMAIASNPDPRQVLPVLMALAIAACGLLLKEMDTKRREGGDGP